MFSMVNRINWSLTPFILATALFATAASAQQNRGHDDDDDPEEYRDRQEARAAYRRGYERGFERGYRKGVAEGERRAAATAPASRARAGPDPRERRLLRHELEELRRDALRRAPVERQALAFVQGLERDVRRPGTRRPQDARSDVLVRPGVAHRVRARAPDDLPQLPLTLVARSPR